MTDYTHDVDARGLSCPLPILRAKKALATMAGGDIVRVRATDPGSVVDFAAYARETGDELLESTTQGDTFIYRLKKAGTPIKNAGEPFKNAGAPFKNAGAPNKKAGAPIKKAGAPDEA